MRRILISCMLSLVIYGLAFGLLLDRPLTLGVLREHIDANLDRGAAITGPKLVILAGSNGPYSHRCEMIGPLVGRPCINAGVAVGVGRCSIPATSSTCRWRRPSTPETTLRPTSAPMPRSCCATTTRPCGKCPHAGNSPHYSPPTCARRS